ncbi:MAG TPA: class I tRNA ligase family protein, partial [Thermoanaerobaculia bacterium]|nr:class I tRNA ligase family protein [Thermoanaerobaculia bacterium]
NVGFCQRSGARVQPLVSTQWFCDVSEMAQRALDAWRDRDDESVPSDRKLEFVPESWGKTWEHWLANIRPWCISRQLWWGHQIPAWYDAAGNCHVARSRQEAEALAGTRELRQDGDVLDTWFSSALWPFSTLGWPDETDDLRKFYPTSVLVTGFDILFFWVARMVMMGLHFTGSSPFEKVHLTGLVRDEEGQKMSKTKGNVLDPEDLIAEYGADAMRFTLAQLDAPGRDIPLDPGRMAGYRAFGNKIWNATRYVLGKVGDARIPERLDFDRLELPERWILSRLSATAGEVDRCLEEFRFDLACHELYQFFWSDFCDWYIEMSKPGLAGETARPQVAEVLLLTLDRALRLLHPVMPYLTEELWQRLPGHEAIHPETICLAPYPRVEESWSLSLHEEDRLSALRHVVNVLRNDRAEQITISKGTPRDFERSKISIEGKDSDGKALAAWLASLQASPLLRNLCKAESIEAVEVLPAIGTKHRWRSIDFSVTFPAEAAKTADPGRIEKDLAEIEVNLERVRARLANPGFTDKAPAAVIAGARQQLAELEGRRATLSDQLASVRGGG